MTVAGPSSAGPAGQRIPELDGWRGLSIILVVSGHLIGLRYGEFVGSAYLPLAGLAAAWGAKIFFVVSGFIITRLALHEYETAATFSASRFYVRRFIRIVPAFFLYLLFI